MLGIFFIAALAVAFMVPADANATASTCQQIFGNEKPKIVIDSLSRDVTYDTTKTVSELQFRQLKHPLLTTALGLTVAHFKSQARVALRVARVRGGYCMKADTILVDFGYESMAVYVDKAYPTGSCQYDVTLEHENEHVTAHYGALDVQLPKLSRDLDRLSKRLSEPVYAVDPKVAERSMLWQINNVVRRHATAADREAMKINNQLDSVENYARLEGLCS